MFRTAIAARLRRLRKWGRLQLLFRPLALLPAPLAYRAASLIGILDARLDRDARAAVRKGMVAAIPGIEGRPAELSLYLSRYFAMLAREVMDVFLMPRIGRRPGGDAIRVEGLDVLHEARREGAGVILVMAHYSRLNMLLLGLARAGVRLGLLTMPIDESNPDLDPVDRAYLKRKVGTLHGFLGGPWVALGGSMRPLYKALAEGEVMVVLVDAYYGSAGTRLTAPFLDGHISVARGIERLAEKTSARLVYGVAHEEGWRIRAELRPLPSDPKQGLAAAVAELEKDVRAAPWSWWHWNVLELIWRAGPPPAQSGVG